MDNIGPINLKSRKVTNFNSKRAKSCKVGSDTDFWSHISMRFHEKNVLSRQICLIAYRTHFETGKYLTRSPREGDGFDRSSKGHALSVSKKCRVV